MIQRFFLNSRITGTPKMFVSAKVWKIQLTIPYECSWEDKNGTLNWKICQILN